MSLSHSTLNCIQTGRGNTLQTKQEAERNQHIEPSYCAVSEYNGEVIISAGLSHLTALVNTHS